MPTSDTIRMKEVRLSFPRLFTPKSFTEGQTPRFEGSFLLDPSNKAHKKAIDTIVDTAEEILLEAFSGEIPDSVECCFQYADASKIDVGSLEWRGKKKTYDGYEGMFVISSSNQSRPTVVDRDLTQLVEEDGKPYAGSYVNASITLWVQDNQFGKRVNANLRAVQFVKDGEAFGVRPADAEEEFDVLDGDDDDDFLD